MWATTELLRFASAVVALLIAALLLRDHRRNATALASVALLAGVAAHLLFLPLLRHGAWQPVLHTVLLVSLTVPVALWLLAHLHFDDDFRFERRHAWSLVAFVAVGYVCWLGAVERRLPAFLFPAESTRSWMLLPKLLGLSWPAPACRMHPVVVELSRTAAEPCLGLPLCHKLAPVASLLQATAGSEDCLCASCFDIGHGLPWSMRTERPERVHNSSPWRVTIPVSATHLSDRLG